MKISKETVWKVLDFMGHLLGSGIAAAILAFFTLPLAPIGIILLCFWPILVILAILLPLLFKMHWGYIILNLTAPVCAVLVMPVIFPEPTSGDYALLFLPSLIFWFLLTPYMAIHFYKKA